MKIYRRIIYGATFFGVGCAIGEERETLILDPGINPGSEFCNAFHPGSGWGKELQWEESIQFRNMLRDHGALAAERLHLAALSPALSHVIRRHQCRVLLNTGLLEVVPIDGVRICRCIAPDGIREYAAEEVIDTLTVTAESLSSLSYNALLHCRNASDCFPEDPNLIPGFFSSEAYFKMPLPVDASYSDARRKLEQFWRNRPDSLADWLIVGTGMCFEKKTCGRCEIAPHHMRIFSGDFANAAVALDAGISEVRK